MRKELPKYHDDEEVDLDEFESIEAEIEEDEWWCESDGEEEIPEGMPTWSNDFESGPPKIEGEELAKVDGVSRAHEIERLTKIEQVAKGCRFDKVQVFVNKSSVRLETQRK